MVWLSAARFAISGPASAAASTAAGAAASHATRLSLWKVLGIGAPTVAAGAVLATDDPAATAQLCRNVPLRLARDVWAAAAIVADYKYSLSGVEGEAYEAAKHGCHERSAQRLLQLCFKNGGVYIKLGQHIGQLDHLLPEEYVSTMRNHLLDRCPVSSAGEVARMIREDLGAPAEQLFRNFDWEPIASASLAQVHRATAHDGRALAVKVQHAGLRESSRADVATIEALVQAVRWVFPTFDYQWLLDETKLNLPKELDFVHEAQNAARCWGNLKGPRSGVVGRVVVPQVLPQLTNHRVMTMEYIDGVKVTDLEGLAAMGARPSAVAALVSQTFNEMIFVHGDVHCDPHAANLLVRPHPRGHGWQLVLLDHGLYRQVDDATRKDYAGLWRSIIFGDVQGIKRHAEGLNAGEAYPLFASMLTARPWDEITGSQSSNKLVIPQSREARERIQGYVAQYAQEITELLLRMPRPLLLMLKTNDCLRSVDLALGQPVNTFTIMARQCTRALAEARTPGLVSMLVSIEERAAVELRIAVLLLITWWRDVHMATHRWLAPHINAAAGI